MFGSGTDFQVPLRKSQPYLKGGGTSRFTGTICQETPKDLTAYEYRKRNVKKGSASVKF